MHMLHRKSRANKGANIAFVAKYIPHILGREENYSLRASWCKEGGLERAFVPPSPLSPVTTYFARKVGEGGGGQEKGGGELDELLLVVSSFSSLFLFRHRRRHR